MSTTTPGYRFASGLVPIETIPKKIQFIGARLKFYPATIQPEISADPPTARDSFYPEPAEELQSIFQQRFDDYKEARKCCSSPDTRISVLEDKLLLIIAKFRIVKAKFPEFYPDIIRLPAFQSMVQSLTSDDYCGDRLASYILLTFEQLTDDDVLVPDQEKHAKEFVAHLVKLGALRVFVSVLDKFPEGSDDIFRALQTIAQMMFLKSDVAESAGKEVKLIEWVMNALEAPRWGKPKEYAVGLLNTLLTCSVENRIQFGEKGFVKVVVNVLSSLENPSKEEKESVDEEHDEEHLLDTSSDSLFLLFQYKENIKRFVDAGGVRLMIRFIRNRRFHKYYYGTAIAALGIAVKDNTSASQEFVNDDLGLDIAFHAFPKIPPSVTHDKEEIEEHLISLISKLLTGGSAKKELLLEKFKENDCEKVTWITKLFIRYYSKYSEAKNYLKDKQVTSVADISYKEKLRYELSMLQPIASILDSLFWSMNSVISARIEEELSHHKLEKKHVVDIFLSFQDGIGDASESSAAKELETNQGIEQAVKTRRSKGRSKRT